MRILGGISSRNSMISGAEKQSMMDFPSVRSGMSVIEPSGFTGGASDLISVTSYETETSYSTCTARSARSAVSAISALSHATTATATSIESSHHSQANSGKITFSIISANLLTNQSVGFWFFLPNRDAFNSKHGNLVYSRLTYI